MMGVRTGASREAVAVVAGILASAALLLVLLPAPALRAADGSPPLSQLRPIVRAGEKGSPFTLFDLDGRKRSFRPGNGETTLVVFWSAFCPLCRELAGPIDLASRRPGNRVRVVWVNLDGKRFLNAVRSFAKEVPITAPVLLDEIRDDLFVACDPYGIEKTPTAVLVGGDGFVRRAYVTEEIRILLRDFGKETAPLRTGKVAEKKR